MKSLFFRYIYLGFSVFLFNLGFLQSTFAQQIPGSVVNLLNKYGIPTSAVSLEVRDADSNKKILSINSDNPRNPASVIKTLTTLSALEILGPNYQWKTRYLVDGEIKNGVLNGDLIFQGGGDPFITTDRFWRQVMLLRQRGIKKITGSLVIDNSYFDIAEHDRSAFDGRPTRNYNVGPDAALVNFSSTGLVIHPIANQIVVFADPPLTDLVIDNRMSPKQGACKSKYNGWSYDIDKQEEKTIARFKGTYNIKCGQHTISRSFFSNNEYAFRLFKFLWNQSGGIFENGYRVSATPKSAIEIINFPSVPLSDAITSINKASNNVMSRQLFLSLGAHRDLSEIDRRGTLDRARQKIKDWLIVNGISMPKLYIDNGSGLSRDSRMTTNNLADLLRHGWNSNYRAEFLSSLSLSSLDGTMRKRLHKTGLRGRARIKTGLINGVRSMAGYVNSRNNRHYSVSMIIQSKNVSFSTGNNIQDAVLKWVYAL